MDDISEISNCNLSNLTVNELQFKLQELGLKKYGNKAALIERLVNYNKIIDRDQSDTTGGTKHPEEIQLTSKGNNNPEVTDESTNTEDFLCKYIDKDISIILDEGKGKSITDSLTFIDQKYDSAIYQKLKNDVLSDLKTFIKEEVKRELISSNNFEFDLEKRFLMDEIEFLREENRQKNTKKV